MKLTSAFLFFILNLCAFNVKAGVVDSPKVVKDPLIYAMLGVDQKSGARIIEPDFVNRSNPSSWTWFVATPTSAGTEVKLLAFEYGWRPTEGLITAERSNISSGGDNIFQSGFEPGMSLIGGGLIDSTWWFRNPSAGPNDWQTDRVIVVLGSGSYRSFVYYDNGTGSSFTYSRFTFEVL